MALFALLSSPNGWIESKLAPLGGRHDVARAPSWSGLTRLVRDRPVAGVLVDLREVEVDSTGRSTLDALKERFPRLPVVVGLEGVPDPNRLLLLGRHRDVRVLMGAQLGCPGVIDGLLEGEFRAGPRRIPVILGQLLPRWPALALYKAVDAVDQGWSADEFSSVMSVRRPYLSSRLRAAGLPSAGSLLTWIKLFYAAWWLPDPGRTAGSVASQLEYSSSQALVRVVRRRLGVTPNGLISKGGLSWAWLRFLSAHPAIAAPQPVAARYGPSSAPLQGTASAGAIF